MKSFWRQSRVWMTVTDRSGHARAVSVFHLLTDGETMNGDGTQKLSYREACREAEDLNAVAEVTQA